MPITLNDTEYAEIGLFLGYPSLHYFNAVKTQINYTLGLMPTLTTYRENQIRDLLKQIHQYRKDIRACEQNYGVVRQPGVVVDSPQRLAMLISAARNAVTELCVLVDVAIADDIFSRGRGQGSVKVSRG